MALEDPPIRGHDPASFPIDTAYDRPVHAMSNLILRGNVDAATRAIFSPNTLTPNELGTMTDKILGPNPNPILKTLSNIATNPLVWLGVIAGYVVFPIKGKALFNLAQGISKAPPVTKLGSYVHSAFANLRNLTSPVGGFSKAKSTSMYDLLNQVTKDSTEFITRYNKKFTAAFAGSHIDEVQGYAMAMKQQNMDKAGSTLVGRFGKKRYAGTGLGLADDVPIMTGYQGKATKEMISVGDKIDNINKEMWKELTKDKKKWAAFEANMQDRGIDIGEEVEGYFARHTSPNPLEKAFAQDLKLPKNKYASDVVSGNLRVRKGGSTVDLKQLAQLEDAGYVTRGTAATIEEGIQYELSQTSEQLRAAVQQARNMPDLEKSSQFLKKFVNKTLNKDGVKHTNNVVSDLLVYRPNSLSIEDAADMLKRPREYSLALDKGIERSLSGIGPTYAYHIKGTGQKIKDFQRYLNQVKGKGGITQWQNAHLNDELLPLIQGKKTWAQYSDNVSYGEFKHMSVEWAQNHPLMKRLPKGAQDFIVKQTNKFDDIGAESIGTAMNQYMYISTLGGNFGPPVRNFMQNILTVAPITGGINLMKGLGSLTKRAVPYLDDIPRIGMEASFKKNFPEFVGAIGDNPGIIKQMLAGDNIQTGTAVARLGKGTSRKVQGALLTPFGTSETINRLWGFYAGRAQGLGLGMADKLDDAARAAGKLIPDAWANGQIVTETAHFTGGALGMPRGLMTMTGVRSFAPLRQFMHFPLRMAGRLIDSVASGVPGRFDLGTIGRTAAFSAGVYEGGKTLMGVDLSSGLVSGALPVPQYESSPFFPFPLVPPGLAIVGNLVKGAKTGEMRPIQEAGWLMVPGGLGIKRLNKTLGSKYADWKNPTPDGRIPVYNKDKALIGTFTKFQLALRSIGIAPMNAEQEKAAATWLASQRDKVRAYKREYLNAMAANDSNKMDGIQRDFQKAYPELGPMTVKKSDVTALRNRREVSRLNRVLRGFPKAYKPLFGNMVAETELGALTQNRDPVNLPGTLTQYE